MKEVCSAIRYTAAALCLFEKLVKKLVRNDDYVRVKLIAHNHKSDSVHFHLSGARPEKGENLGLQQLSTTDGGWWWDSSISCGHSSHNCVHTSCSTDVYDHNCAIVAVGMIALTCNYSAYLCKAFRNYHSSLQV